MTDAIPRQELEHRWNRCRRLLQKYVPAAEGLIIFSRLNIYYFTGTFGNGLLFLPMENEPVLLCRRGEERAALETPLEHIFHFESYGNVEDILKETGVQVPKKVAVEMNGLSWALSRSFQKYLSDYKFLPGDKVIAMARGKKSDWELEKLRSAGKSHAKCLTELLPPLLSHDMTELDIAHTVSKVFYDEGHHGILRMSNYGEEVFMGHISAGDSGNYPSVFNGPVGLRGVHPAVPHMGSAAKKWRAREVLIIDNGFTHEGYQTDKTQVYWLGEQDSIPAYIQAAHDFCVNLQNWLSENLKPGILASDLWRKSQAKAEKTDFFPGFMGLGSNKVRFVGHGIGLAIDEFPVLAEGFDVPLETGMVLAIEPKIGIPDVGMVGVENTYEVTPEGGRCLTGDRYEIICVTSS